MKQRRLSGYRNLLVAGARGSSLNRGLLNWPTFIQFSSSVLLPILSQRSHIRSFIFKASSPSIFITHFDLPSALIASELECVILMTVHTLTPESLGLLENSPPLCIFRGPAQICSPFLITNSRLSAGTASVVFGCCHRARVSNEVSRVSSEDAHKY